ncbi:MAG: TIGR03364 family FAD-dependent oxidoreductase [Ginsengibacter sp.]
MNTSSAIVIGAGIVGLATARALSLKGYNVTVIERSEKAIGASVRNFGMIWPIGQPDGKLYSRAMRSKMIWKEIADSISLPYEETGSLHLAYHDDEWQVLQEVHEIFLNSNRHVSLMSKDIITGKFNSVNQNGLLGGLYSDAEMIIDPREGLALIPLYLSEYLDIKFIWGQAVTSVGAGIVYLNKQEMEADVICICSGEDFKSLYPDEFSNAEITKCKLQMMRFVSEDKNYRIGTSLCGGLSLVHYKSFSDAHSLPKLKKRFEEEMPEYVENGIHVMVAQNSKGELTIGDSHQYGSVFEPFNHSCINKLIVKYLKQFANIDSWRLVQTWNGIYPKMTNEETDLFIEPEPGVFIINGLGGAGMTLSFGLAEEIIERI